MQWKLNMQKNLKLKLWYLKFFFCYINKKYEQDQLFEYNDSNEMEHLCSFFILYNS